MAGLRGNQAWLLAMKQTGKLGASAAPTPAAATAFKNPFAGGSIAPSRTTDRLSETDSSRDVGVAYVQTVSAEGSPEIYVRDESFGFWMWAAMGTVAVTGTTPNYTHTITPGATLPYITVWRDQSDTLYEEFKDCKVSSINIAAEAGNPLTATLGIQGARYKRLTATPDSVSPVTLANQPVYNFNNATVTLGAGAVANIRSFDLTVENNVSTQQTDDVLSYDVIEGQREISLGFDMIFEDLNEYNNFHTGTTTGTDPAFSIYQTNMDFTFTLGANNEIKFTLPRVAYQEFPVEPNTNGDPIIASVRAVGQRGGTPILTTVIKNQYAAY